METKECITCREERLLKYFDFRNDTKKYRNQCNTCYKGYIYRRGENNQKVVDGSKDCGKCKINQPVSQFHTDRTTNTGLTSWCKTCKTDYVAKNKEAIRIGRIANVYKIDKNRAKELCEHKECEICGLFFEGNNIANIDHSHDHGYVRGVLCFKCNVGIGNFKDDPELLAKAAKYLLDKTPKHDAK